MGCCNGGGSRPRGRSRRIQRKIVEFREFNESREIEDIVAQSGVDIGDIDMDQLRMGINVEKEHDGKMGKDTDVVKKKSDIVKIAVAHLREDPEYYSKLKKIEGE
jgi:hypothetical protein